MVNFRTMEFSLNGAKLSLNSENLRNHWGMNWVRYKDLLCCLWLCGWVVKSLSLTQEILGSNPAIFFFDFNFFVTEFSEFSEKHWKKHQFLRKKFPHKLELNINFVPFSFYLHIKINRRIWKLDLKLISSARNKFSDILSSLNLCRKPVVVSKTSLVLRKPSNREIIRWFRNSAIFCVAWHSGHLNEFVAWIWN